MKNRMKLTSLFFLVLCLTFSCSSDETSENNSTQQINKFEKISNLELDLNLNFEIGKEIPIKKEDISSFLASNFEEIKSLENDLFLTFEVKGINKIVYSVDDLNSLQNKLDADPPGFWNTPGLNCTKCRNESCVKTTVGNAIGDGSTQVFIGVTPNFSFGVQTSISICYGSLEDMIAEFAP
ncbi:hypothetical protein ACW5R3_08310 [Bizionia sp. KMM 8389]